MEARKIPSIDPVGWLFHFLSLNIEQRDEVVGQIHMPERERTSISVSEAGACRFSVIETTH